MFRLKTLSSLVLLFLFIGFFQTCKKSEYNYKYINLVEFFPYMTKVFEENHFKFTSSDLKRSKYVLKGFRMYMDQLPRTWAVEKESTIIAYFSVLEDKPVVLRCRPFNPPGQPHQIGEIFVNGKYLKKIEFKKKGYYDFNIPSNLLKYGSNSITFKWKYLRAPYDFGLNNDKRKYAVGFLYLKLQNKSLKNKKRKKLREIRLNSKTKIPGIDIPQGGIVEYYFKLPEESCLKFRLSSRQRYLKNATLNLAIYNKKGGKTVLYFKNDQFNSRKEHKLNLNKFAKETIKLVFSNSIRNHPNFIVSLINPAIYSPTEKKLPVIFQVERGEIGKKKIKKQQNNKKRPNVFIYLIDTLRADHLSCYGYFRETTPYVDKFSKNSILFKNCYATASWTKPSVGSILTGLYPGKHKAEDKEDKLSNEVKMISEVLKSTGYTTIYITPNINASRDVNFDQGNDIYKFSKSGNNIRYFYHSSEIINSEFFEIVENIPDLMDKPLFAFLHTVDPHDPYTPEAPFLKFKKFDKEREKLGLPDFIRLKKKTKGLSQEDISYIKSLYDCEILHNDYYFGKFIYFLKEKNLLKNSIIVLIADHGEQFDEHDRLFHGHSIYNEEIHVPLIIKLPYGEFSGIRTDTIVSQVDIFPTILDYLGIEISSEVDGISILDILKNNHLKRSVFIKEKLNRDNKNDFVGIINTRNSNKHIITYKDESFVNAVNFELYDLVEDFNERKDLLDKRDMFRIKSAKFFADYYLEKIESSIFKEEKKLDFNKLDPEKIKHLKALGYIN